MATAYYLAGPMSNVPFHNFPLFDEVAAELRGNGYNIVSPAELDDPDDRAAALSDESGDIERTNGTWGDYLARDVKIVSDQVDGIVFLPGWADSRGACLEAYVGLLTGKEFFAWVGEGKIAPVPAQEVSKICMRKVCQR